MAIIRRGAPKTYGYRHMLESVGLKRLTKVRIDGSRTLDCWRMLESMSRERLSAGEGWNRSAYHVRLLANVRINETKTLGC